MFGASPLFSDLVIGHLVTGSFFFSLHQVAFSSSFTRRVLLSSLLGGGAAFPTWVVAALLSFRVVVFSSSSLEKSSPSFGWWCAVDVQCHERRTKEATWHRLLKLTFFHERSNNALPTPPVVSSRDSTVWF